MQRAAEELEALRGIRGPSRVSSSTRARARAAETTRLTQIGSVLVSDSKFRTALDFMADLGFNFVRIPVVHSARPLKEDVPH